MTHKRAQQLQVAGKLRRRITIGDVTYYPSPSYADRLRELRVSIDACPVVAELGIVDGRTLRRRPR